MGIPTSGLLWRLGWRIMTLVHSQMSLCQTSSYKEITLLVKWLHCLGRGHEAQMSFSLLFCCSISLLRRWTIFYLQSCPKRAYTVLSHIPWSCLIMLKICHFWDRQQLQTSCKTCILNLLVASVTFTLLTSVSFALRTLKEWVIFSAPRIDTAVRPVHCYKLSVDLYCIDPSTLIGLLRPSLDKLICVWGLSSKRQSKSRNFDLCLSDRKGCKIALTLSRGARSATRPESCSHLRAQLFAALTLTFDLPLSLLISAQSLFGCQFDFCRSLRSASCFKAVNTGFLALQDRKDGPNVHQAWRSSGWIVVSLFVNLSSLLLWSFLSGSYHQTYA